VDAEITGLPSNTARAASAASSSWSMRARAAGLEPLSRDHAGGRGLAGNVGSLPPAFSKHRLDRNRLSAARRSGRQRASRAGARVPAARRLPAAGRTRPRGARAAAGHRAGRAGAGRWRSWSCSALPAGSS
jgi:hypothetical protein